MSDDPISKPLKSVLIFIDRAGLPAFTVVSVFGLIFYLVFIFSNYLKENSTVMLSLKDTIVSISDNNKYFQNEVKYDHKDLRQISCEILKNVENKQRR
jgi:hypothetical protein